MADEEGEYEIVPEKEVEDLKKQVEEVRKNPLGSTPSGRELLKAVKELNESINHLTGLFQDAADSMKLEEKESDAIGKKLSPMLEKLDTLIDQNEKIARGIVSVADMVKEDLGRKKQQAPGPSTAPGPQGPQPQQQMGRPPSSQSGQPGPQQGQPIRVQVPPAGVKAPQGPPPSPPSGAQPPKPPEGSGTPPPPPQAPKEKPKRKLFGF